MASIRQLASEERRFSYGGVDAMILPPGGLDKPARRMQGQVNALAQHLSLPLRSDENEHSAIRHNNGNSFVQVDTPAGQHWIMVRSPLDGREIKDIVGSQPPHINIVSGPCLYSAHTAQAIAADGTVFSLTHPGEEIDQAITKLHVDNQLSTYEIEAVVRLSSIIQTLTKHTAHIEEIFLNIPHTEYYLYILDAYNAGHISSALATEWFKNVDTRHSQLTQLMRKRVIKNVGREISVAEATPLEPIRQYIVETVKRGQTPLLSSAINLLKSSSQLWADLLETEQPDSWHHLNYLCYVFAELQAGMSPNDNDKQVVAIAIENPIEVKIFATAKKLAPRLPQRGYHFNVIGLYPHEQVVPIGENDRALMYYLHEGQQARREHVRLAVRPYRRI